MAERSAKIASYPVLKVFRRYASFRVALGFAQPPRQFARIPEQRFQPPAEGLYVWVTLARLDISLWKDDFTPQLLAHTVAD
jgi:hypothetical protein